MTEQDPNLDAVERVILNVPNYRTRVGHVLRSAFDEVIDGPRTQRWSVAELEKVEKTYIGTKVELLLRTAMGFARGKELDYLIAGHEVDAKFSLKKGGWMIPSEAVGRYCLLISADDTSGHFEMGLLHAREEFLSRGQNKDGKRHLAAEHRKTVRWLAQAEPFPRNFLMHQLSPTRREQIFNHAPGQPRVNALFELIQHQPIPASAVAIIAREEVDVRAKTAAAQATLKDSLCILSGDDPSHRQTALDAGLVPPEPGEYMSVSRYRLVGGTAP